MPVASAEEVAAVYNDEEQAEDQGGQGVRHVGHSTVTPQRSFGTPFRNHFECSEQLHFSGFLFAASYGPQ
jgi:hypothetical protein